MGESDEAEDVGAMIADSHDRGSSEVHGPGVSYRTVRAMKLFRVGLGNKESVLATMEPFTFSVRYLNMCG